MEEIFLITTEENTHHQLFCYIIKYPQFGETKERYYYFYVLDSQREWQKLAVLEMRVFMSLCSHRSADYYWTVLRSGQIRNLGEEVRRLVHCCIGFVVGSMLLLNKKNCFSI
jgi:hypothetical protein